MNIGQEVKVGKMKYWVSSPIKENGTHADVWKVVDSDGKQFLLKKFKPKKRANAWLPYRSKSNHFGRVREAHHVVFQELRSVTSRRKFLVEHFQCEREWYLHQGEWTWSWMLVQEYVKGMGLGEFIEKHPPGSSPELERAFYLLGKAVGEFHHNEFAHGDPHLYNAMVVFENTKPSSVQLVDYSQLHHPSFEYCKRCNCFSPHDRRMKEDMENDGVMGRGFLHEIRKIEERRGIPDKRFELHFLNGYREMMAPME